MPKESPPAGTTPGSLIALDATTGKVLWQIPTPMAALSLPAVSDGRIFVQGGYDCRGNTAVLTAFSGKDGAVLWQVPTAPDPFETPSCASGWPPAAMHGVVVGVDPLQAPSPGLPPDAAPGFPFTSIRGLDPRSGKELWTAMGLEPVASSGPLLMRVASPSGGMLLAGLDPTTGRELWVSTDKGTNGPLALNDHEALLLSFYGPASPQLSAIDLGTGGTVWQFRPGQGDLGNTVLTLSDEVALVSFMPMVNPPSLAPPTSILIALDAATGDELWRKDLQGGNPVGVKAVPGTIYIQQQGGSGNGPCTLQALDPTTGSRRWSITDVTGCPYLPAASPSMFLDLNASPSAASITAFDAMTGSKLWEQPLPPMHPCSGPCGQDFPKTTIEGNVVYVSMSGIYLAYPVTGD